jgi:hypothetical protein
VHRLAFVARVARQALPNGKSSKLSKGLIVLPTFGGWM